MTSHNTVDAKGAQPESQKKEWFTPEVRDQSINSLTEAGGGKFFFPTEGSATSGPVS